MVAHVNIVKSSKLDIQTALTYVRFPGTQRARSTTGKHFLHFNRLPLKVGRVDPRFYCQIEYLQVLFSRR